MPSASWLHSRALVVLIIAARRRVLATCGWLLTELMMSCLTVRIRPPTENQPLSVTQCVCLKR